MKTRLLSGFAAILAVFAIQAAAVPAADRVETGLDRLIRDFPDTVSGKRVGIIGNHTSKNSEGRSIVEIVGEIAEITALYGPEHGFFGDAGAGVAVRNASLNGIPIYSLYGEFRMPTRAMLKDVDVLIYDIQDVGVKFYTYISNLFYAMCAAARDGKPVVVLDRPNPIGAERVEGAVTYPPHASFVGVMPLPVRYGLTVGELARLFNEETYAGFAIGANLTVIPMKNHRRSMWHEDTGLPWIAPSPNMPTPETAMAYPGTCLIEGTNLSEGRGTDAPFLTLGAPFIGAERWIAALPEGARDGLRIEAVSFTPRSIPGVAGKPKYLNQTCNGIRIRVEDRDRFKPIDFAVSLLCAARDLHPAEFRATPFLDRLWGNENLRAFLDGGADARSILETAKAGAERFEAVREAYRLYE